MYAQRQREQAENARLRREAELRRKARGTARLANNEFSGPGKSERPASLMRKPVALIASR